MNKMIQRLEYLCNMLNKYGHCWGENPSSRMYAWVDEYDSFKENNPFVWGAYCQKNGYTVGHTAFDCMA